MIDITYILSSSNKNHHPCQPQSAAQCHFFTWSSFQEGASCASDCGAFIWLPGMVCSTCCRKFPLVLSMPWNILEHRDPHKKLPKGRSHPGFFYSLRCRTIQHLTTKKIQQGVEQSVQESNLSGNMSPSSTMFSIVFVRNKVSVPRGLPPTCTLQQNDGKST